MTYKYTEQGEKVRVSRRSGRIIPKPAELLDRKDFKSRSGYAGELKKLQLNLSFLLFLRFPEGLKDTSGDAVLLRTYTPSLMTFEEDITKLMEKCQQNSSAS